MWQLASQRTWQQWAKERMAPVAAPAAPPEAALEEAGAGEEDFQQRLMSLKADLQVENAPASLEDLLREGAGKNGTPASEGGQDELRKEFEKLRQNLEQARQRISQFEKDQELWHTREKEYEMMLEEKSELIRQLHQELRAQPVIKADGPSEDELVALHQELQRERQMLEEDRGALEEQFRVQEIQLSKERAEIAKVRSEAQRMQNEVKRQMEILEREAKVRGEMGNFMKLREELQANANRTAPGGRPTPTPSSAPTPMPDLPSLDRKAPDGGQQSRKSFFGGLFRRGDE